MRQRGLIALGDQRPQRRSAGRLRRRVRNTVVVGLAISYLAWAKGTMDEETRVRQAQVDISRIEHAVRLFRADHGRCPDDLTELTAARDGDRYLNTTVDPWGQPYRLGCPALRDPGGVEVVSGGPDGSLAGRDNISSL